jgi:ankyrin repeat protein
MSHQSTRAAIDAGDVDGLRALLTVDPQMAREQVEWGDESGRHLSDPIGYVSLARFHGLSDHERMGEITQVLLAAGAPVEGEPNRRETPLVTAASYGEIEVAGALIEAGADLESRGFAVPDGTALQHAVFFGNSEVAQLLVAAGARVESLEEAAGAGDLGGFNVSGAPPEERARALRAAAVCERLSAIDQLLAADTPIDSEVDSGTPLHWAAWHAKLASARHLVDRGADPGRRDPEHDATPLDWCRYRHQEIPAGTAHGEVEAFLQEITAR